MGESLAQLHADAHDVGVLDVISFLKVSLGRLLSSIRLLQVKTLTGLWSSDDGVFVAPFLRTPPRMATTLFGVCLFLL